jgi:multiple antibiotic resistance protein
MILGESKPEEELKMVKDLNETAILPIATPSIVSPGTMLAAVLLTENSEYGILEQLYSTFLIIASNYALLILKTDQIK